MVAYGFGDGFREMLRCYRAEEPFSKRTLIRAGVELFTVATGGTALAVPINATNRASARESHDEKVNRTLEESAYFIFPSKQDCYITVKPQAEINDITQKASPADLEKISGELYTSMVQSLEADSYKKINTPGEFGRLQNPGFYMVILEIHNDASEVQAGYRLVNEKGLIVKSGSSIISKADGDYREISQRLSNDFREIAEETRKNEMLQQLLRERKNKK